MRSPLPRMAMGGLIAITLLIGARWARGQAEEPPERESSGAQQKLPKLETPAAKTSGQLAIQFVGATAFPEKELRAALSRQVQDIEQSGLNDATAYDTGFFLESFYRKNGYSQVSAKGQITGASSVRLVVKEGPLTRIGSVSIPGAKNYTTLELTNYLLGPTRERFPRIKKDKELPFVEADVQGGVDLVTRLYAGDGFLDAIITPPETVFSADKRMIAITLRVEEGPQYWFGNVAFSGPAAYTRDELIRVFAEELGKPFTHGRLDAARRKLEDFYKKHGHFIATVEARGDKASAVRNKVPVTFVVAPGPRHRFDGITVRGLDRVKPQFVQNRMMKLRDKTYDPALTDERFRELIQTGLFKNLRINPVRVTGNQVRLDLEIEEAKAKEFGIGLGFASYEGAIASLTYTDRNFLRSARPLTLGIEYTSRGYKGEVLWSDPWLFETDYRFRARLYALTREHEGYSKRELGFQPSLARNITKQWEVSAFLLAKQVEFTDFTIDPPELLGRQKYLANSAGFSSTLDFRNNAANPSRGFIGTATLDAASSVLGSEVEFVRGTFRLSYYLPVTRRTVLAFGARGGVIAPTGGSATTTVATRRKMRALRTRQNADLIAQNDTRLPIDERFFSGGSTSVRSFVERDLGPKDRNGLPIGGEAFTVFNVEYNFPIFGDVKGAVFADAGNLKSRADDFGISDLRYAFGAGVRYNLPFGPIRLDYGLNPSPRADEDRGAFHLSVGVAF